MGVYIPNMKMQKSCFDCFAYDGEFMECRATGECVNETFYDKVRDDCPLVEIPTPHGRLIDASELIKSYMKGTKTDIDDFYDTIDIIDNAPTILEAEE